MTNNYSPFIRMIWFSKLIVQQSYLLTPPVLIFRGGKRAQQAWWATTTEQPVLKFICINYKYIEHIIKQKDNATTTLPSLCFIKSQP